MMHISGDAGSGSVPAFLTKLWALVEDNICDDLICWDSSGRSFHVFDQARFSKEVLPLYFKHNNIASFIRQLNMYGFRKLTNLEQGSLKTEKDDLEFHHPFFQKDEEQLLENIRRKISKVESVKLTQNDVTKVLNEVKVMQSKQSNMNHKMESMKRENEALWREVATLRQKHIKQQQIVNKLIQFLASLVGRSRPGLKRKLPLMLNDSSQIVPQKITQFNRQLSIEEKLKNEPSTDFDLLSNPSGPIIHEVTDTPSLLCPGSNRVSCPPASSTIPLETALATCDSLSTKDCDNFLSFGSETAKSLLPDHFPEGDAAGIPPDLNSQSLVLFPEITIPEMKSEELKALSSATNRRNAWTTSDRSSVLSENYSLQKEVGIGVNLCSEVTDHVDTLQTDLDSLKDFLQTGFDTSTLSGLFNTQSPVAMPSFGDLLFDDSGRLDINTNTGTSSSGNIIGHELVQYTSPEDVLPSLFDFTESDPILLGGVDIGTDFDTLNTPLLPEDQEEKSKKQRQIIADELD